MHHEVVGGGAIFQVVRVKLPAVRAWEHANPAVGARLFVHACFENGLLGVAQAVEERVHGWVGLASSVRIGWLVADAGFSDRATSGRAC